jgi:ABC-type multidrug transport system fused ATPase/permease subunit
MIKKYLLGENYPSDPSAGKKLDGSMWAMLFTQIRDFRYYYFLGAVCLFFTHYIQSQLPVLAKEVAELVGEGKEFKKYYLLLFFAVGIVVFRTLSRLLYFFPARILERDFRLNLVKKLESCPPSRYRTFTSGNIFQTIFSDVEQMRAMVGFALLQLGNVIIAGAVLLPQISNFNDKLLLPLSPMLISSLIFTLVVARMRKYSKAALDAQALVQNNIIESYNGKETIKNFHAEKSFIKNFNSLSYKELFNFYIAGKGIAFSIPLIPLGVGASLVWGAKIISSEGMEASSLIYYSGMTFLFLEPLAFISWIGIVFVSSAAAWDRIKELVDKIEVQSEQEKSLIKINNEEKKLKILFWEKELEFNFDVNRKYVFVGPTGEGKTEILAQLAYLYKRRGYKIGYVAQNPYVFDDTLEKNLFLGENITPEKKDKALKLLDIFSLKDLEDSVDKLFKMPLGENGKRLSGGQIKRMCLVRSLLLDSDLYVWDDPFSSVDLILEKDIISKLNNLNIFDNKILIFSSHRLASVKYSNELILLNKHKGIEELGETGLLLESSQVVQKFFEEQSFTNSKEAVRAKL